MGSSNNKGNKEISCKGGRGAPQTPSVPGFELGFLGLEVRISSNMMAQWDTHHPPPGGGKRGKCRTGAF